MNTITVSNLAHWSLKDVLWALVDGTIEVIKGVNTIGFLSTEPFTDSGEPEEIRLTKFSRMYKGDFSTKYFKVMTSVNQLDDERVVYYFKGENHK